MLDGPLIHVNDPLSDPLDFEDPTTNQALQEEKQADDFGYFLAEAVFHNLHDPVGVKIRDLMRASWHDSPGMLEWLNIVETEKRFPTKKEVADRIGQNPAVFHARHWKPRWKTFLLDLRSKTTLLKALQDRAADAGLNWTPENLLKSDPDSLLAPVPGRSKPRAAMFHQVLASRLTQRFVLSRSW